MKVKYALCLVAITVLAGCASSPGSQKQDLVYDPPPPPTTFDLDVYLTAKYMASATPLRINGRDYSIADAITYIEKQKTKKLGPYTVLLHGLNGGDVKLGAYLCFVPLVLKAGAIGYVGGGEEKPSAPKMTIVGGDYSKTLRKCENP